MTARFMSWPLALFLLMLCLTPAAARSGPPVSSKVTALPALRDAGETARLVGIDQRPVVLNPRGAFRLATDKRSWKALRADALIGLGTIHAVASDGNRAVLIAGRDGVAERIVRLGIVDDGLTTLSLPPLPEPLRAVQPAIAGDTLWVAGLGPDGGARLFKHSLSASAPWTAQPAWPGGAPAALGAQNKGVFATLVNGEQWRWFPDKGWRAGAKAPATIVPGSARAIGQAYLLYLGTDADGATRLYSYSAITDAWAALGPPQSVAPRVAVSYGDGLLAARNGANGLEFTAIELVSERQSLALLDWLIIGVYMFGMLGVGFYFYRGAKNGSSSEFFLGSRAIPAWAAGISMFAGSISSISYLAIPAKAYETNWQYIMSKISTIAGLIFVAILIVPLFRRLDLVSVFNYLETRFHPSIRLLSSALWMLMQIGGRMGIVLFLPAMAIGTITDTNIVACIIIVGIFTIVYTALGGMKAVVWTDVFQVMVLTGGACFAIGFIVYQLGLMSVIETARTFEKTDMVNLSFDVTQPTLWGFLILVLFDVVLTFPKDQVLMQRVLATPSEKEASRSVWVFAVVLLPSAFMFYIIGTVLFAYYRENPAQLNPMLPIDAVFPAFIGTELPVGVTGLIIAGLFAAAMGTLSGIINSVATLLSVDFYGKFRNPTQAQTVRFAEWMSVVVGLIGIGIAIILSRMDIHSLLDLTIELFGLLGGSCAGAYTLGMFTRRANWQGVAIGIIAASLLTLVVWILGLIHPYWYLALAIMASIVIGYLASLLFPPPRHSLQGLTIYDRGRKKTTDA
ncbi:sodium:solute symporter [Sphingomonas sp. MS122]|uniref:sodium:solute symporter n=1 Tax=Sphingomonas sp. MS122 TaxID=3412683 RepID=UPI003C30C2E3